MQTQKVLFKSVTIYSIGNLFTRSIFFLLLPLYSNFISVDNFGKYSIIQSFYLIFSILYQGGLLTSLSKYYLEEKEEQKRKLIFSSLLDIIIITGAVFTFIFIIFSKQISSLLLSSIAYDRLITFIFLALFLETISVTLLHLLRTQEKAKAFILFSSLSAISTFILNIYFVLILKKGIEGIILAQFYSVLFTLVFMIPVIRSNFIFSFNKNVLKLAVFFGFPMLLSGLMSRGTDVADRFILNHFFNESEVGVYSFSYRISTIMNVIVISFNAAWLPFSIKRYYEGNYEIIFGKILNNIIAVGGLIVLILSFFIRYLFDIEFFGYHIFNVSYKSGAAIIPIVLIGQFFNFFSSFYALYPYTSGKSYHLLIADSIGLSSNILLNFIFIPVWGITGAAYATLISFLISAIYLGMISFRKIKINYFARELFLILMGILVLLIIGLSFDSIIINFILIAAYLILVKFPGKSRITGLIQ